MYYTGQYKSLDVEEGGIGRKMADISQRNVLLLAIATFSFLVMTGLVLMSQSSTAVRFTCIPDPLSTISLKAGKEVSEYPFLVQ